MNNTYKLVSSKELDKERLIQYKLNSILDYAGNLEIEEINRIKDYVMESIPKEISHYKNIIIEGKVIGCLLVEQEKDGVLIDELYIDKEYRGKGIGTDILKNIIKENKIVYLWVYKLNENAIRLYKKLGFIIVSETESRYYMEKVSK